MMNNRRIQYKTARRHILSKYFTLAAITFTMVITLSLTFFTMGIKAEETSGEPSYKYYTQIVVQYGDTLEDIAKQYSSDEYKNYGQYIREVRNINSLYSDNIKPGSYLIVPYYDTVLK